ncbi:MAG TPA: PilZ domain-containing protein [Candidatus Eremiobacteraceae bacterium]|nr:PilZ domain-containing protein [Candidatus Eremiobacteraceae bacterium]
MIGRRRASPRVPVNEQVLLREGDDDDVCPVLLSDLSCGGACIRTDLRLAVGDVVWLAIELDGEEPFEFAAKVLAVHAQDRACYYEYGLRIVEATLENASRLNAFVDRREAGARR